MKKIQIAGFALLAVTMMVASCGKKAPVQARYIPKDASYVIALDAKSMMTKLEQDSLSVEQMLNVVKDDKDPAAYATALEYWKKFQESGLDFESKFFLAIPKLNIDKGSVTAEVVAPVRDAAKLEAFITNLPNNPTITKEGDLNLVSTPEFALGWNKEVAVILAKGGADLAAYMPDDSNDVQMLPGANGEVPSLLKTYFTLKKEESIASLESFVEMLGEKADVAVFSNAGSLTGSANAALAMMPKIKELLEGMYSTTFVNFEDGKISMQSNTFAGEKLAAFLKKYAGPTVDMSLLDHYPSQQVNGYMAFSFKPELIPGLLQETGVEALANLALTQAGTNSEELAKAFKGDFAVIFSDFSMDPMNLGKDAAAATFEPKANLLVAIKMGDKSAFDKLVAAGEKEGMVRHNGNRIELVEEAGAPQKMFVGLEGDLLVIGSDSAVYNGYLAKSGGKAYNESVGSPKGKSIAFYLDVASILKAIPESLFSEEEVHEKNVLLKSREVFQSMAFGTNNFDGKKIQGSGEVVLAKGKNSLPQMVRFLMYAAEEMKESTATRMGPDSVAVEAPPAAQ